MEKKLILDFRRFELKLCCVTLGLLLKFSEPHFPNLYLINLLESPGSFIHHAFITWHYYITLHEILYIYICYDLRKAKKRQRKNSVLALILKLKDIIDHNHQNPFYSWRYKNWQILSNVSHRKLVREPGSLKFSLVFYHLYNILRIVWIKLYHIHRVRNTIPANRITCYPN